MKQNLIPFLITFIDIICGSRDIQMKHFIFKCQEVYENKLPELTLIIDQSQ